MVRLVSHAGNIKYVRYGVRKFPKWDWNLPPHFRISFYIHFQTWVQSFLYGWEESYRDTERIIQAGSTVCFVVKKYSPRAATPYGVWHNFTAHTWQKDVVKGEGGPFCSYLYGLVAQRTENKFCHQNCATLWHFYNLAQMLADRYL